MPHNDTRSQGEKNLNAISQVAIPGLTILSYLITSFKHPEIGLMVNLLAQPFWFYSSWIAYKKGGQYGLLITTILLTIILIIGIINYRFF